MAHFSLIADEELKFILLKRPKISIVANYKINTKAAHNHFQRYSDVKVKGSPCPFFQVFTLLTSQFEKIPHFIV